MCVKLGCDWQMCRRENAIGHWLRKRGRLTSGNGGLVFLTTVDQEVVYRTHVVVLVLKDTLTTHNITQHYHDVLSG